MAPWRSDTVTATPVLINQIELQVTGAMSESVLRSSMVLLTENTVKRKDLSTIPPAIIQDRMGKAIRITSPSTHILALVSKTSILTLLASTVATIVTKRGRLQVTIQKMDLSIIPATVVDIVRIVTRSVTANKDNPDIIPRRDTATDMVALTRNHCEDSALESVMPYWQSTPSQSCKP